MPKREGETLLRTLSRSKRTAIDDTTSGKSKVATLDTMLIDSEHDLTSAIDKDAVRSLYAEAPKIAGYRPLSAKQEQVAMAIALGRSNREIAASTGFCHATVAGLRNRPDIRERVRRLQIAAGFSDFKDRFSAILPNAIEIAETLMSDSTVNATTRADIAFRFMDRALGKATTPIEASGNLLRDIITKLDQAESTDMTTLLTKFGHTPKAETTETPETPQTTESPSDDHSGGNGDGA